MAVAVQTDYRAIEPKGLENSTARPEKGTVVAEVASPTVAPEVEEEQSPESFDQTAKWAVVADDAFVVELEEQQQSFVRTSKLLALVSAVGLELERLAFVNRIQIGFLA